MDAEERLERFEAVLDYLAEASATTPILVEGARDEAALRELGIPGEILVYNRIGSMIATADFLRGKRRVIVMFDWDRKGGQLAQLLRGQLAGLVELDLEPRKEFARVSLVKCVEDLTHARRTLENRAGRSHRFDF